MALALFEGRFYRHALQNFLLQFEIGGSQLHSALAQHFDEFFELDGGVSSASMGFFNRQHRHRKKYSGLPDNGGPPARRVARSQVGDQGLLMQFSQIQSLQAGRQRFAA